MEIFHLKKLLKIRGKEREKKTFETLKYELTKKYSSNFQKWQYKKNYIYLQKYVDKKKLPTD